jgi:hypothetical protein
MGEGEGADGSGRAASERDPCERESGEVLTGGAQRSGGGSGARVGPPGPEERGGGGKRARASWLGFGPAEGGERVFPFPFLISFLFLFLFYFCVFLFLFLLSKFL